ncbi:MAG: M23 family metallopeptidase [Granulosicoccus sp.]
MTTLKQPVHTLFAVVSSAILCLACTAKTTPFSTHTPPPLVSGILDLKICPMQVSNKPSHVDGQVNRRYATGCLNGVDLLVAPAPDACLSSGFGRRNGRQHRGLDFQSRPAGPVIAAASGRVIELGVRPQDFGRWIVLDHDAGVYTAYAHLNSTSPGLQKGSRVVQGQSLGIMGSSGAATRAVHLHYEVRRGTLPDDISHGQFFGLEALNPFDLPANCLASR